MPKTNKEILEKANAAIVDGDEADTAVSGIFP